MADDPYHVGDDTTNADKKRIKSLDAGVFGESEKKLIQFLKEKMESCSSEHGAFQSQWNELRRFVRTDTSVPGSKLTNGERTGLDIFDATAPQANETFASGLSAYLVPSTDRWFALTFANTPESLIDQSARRWFDETADVMYHHLSLPSSNFNPTMHEVFLDIGAFGTGVFFQDVHSSGVGACFKAFPLDSVRIREDFYGRVDTVFRKTEYTVRQVMQAWPDATRNERFAKMKENDKVCVWHAVFPNTDRDIRDLGWRGRMFVSAWWIDETEQVLSVGGYETLPYHCVRWAKGPGEIYGRSPGMSVLADIKMVNAMSKEIIFSAELANRPPLIIDDESLLMPLTSLVPGTLLYKQPGSEKPEALMSGSQPQLTLELLAQRQQSIKDGFYEDLFFRNKKKERQSVLEIQDDRAEITRQLTPMFGRIEMEALSPLLSRLYHILSDQGVIPPPPFDPEDRQMEIQYVNPATKAQVIGRSAATNQFVTSLASLAQVDPTVLDVLDIQETAMELANSLDVPQRLIRTKEQIAAIRGERAKAQQAQAQAEQGQVLSQTVLNTAKARATDPSMI